MPLPIGSSAASVDRPVALDMPLVPLGGAAAGAPFQACRDACEGMLRAHRPDLPAVLPPALADRLNGNVEKLMAQGYDTPDRIRHFADQCLHHDLKAKIAANLVADIAPDVANFMGMHDPALLGVNTADGSLTGIGLKLGAILGLVDFISSNVVQGAAKPLLYHEADPHAVDKMLNPGFSADGFGDTMRQAASSAAQSAAKSLAKNAWRIPAVALSSSQGLVNTNNTPVVRGGAEVVRQGAAGLVDNSIDSFAPLLVKPFANMLLERPLAPSYKASLMLSDKLDDTIQRAGRSWGEAIKTGAWNAAVGAGNGALGILKPAAGLVPGIATVALMASAVAYVFNVNTAINEHSRDAWSGFGPNGTLPGGAMSPDFNQSAANQWPAVNGTRLMPGIVPTSGYMASRAHSTGAFAATNAALVVVAKMAEWLTDKAVNAGTDAWTAYRSREAGAAWPGRPRAVEAGPDELAAAELLGGSRASSIQSLHEAVAQAPQATAPARRASLSDVHAAGAESQPAAPPRRNSSVF